MDTCPKLTVLENPLKTKAWQPQSRIAGYIRGDLKLEDIIGKDKIVRPQDRHNKRAFLPPLNNEEITLSSLRKQPTIRKCIPRSGRNLHTKIDSSTTLTDTSSANTSLTTSRSNRCHSTGTKTSNSADPAEISDSRSTLEKLARIVIVKDEEILKLKEKIGNFFDFVHLEVASHSDDCANDDVVPMVSRLFDSLINISTNLQNVDENEKRIAVFITNIERIRHRWNSFYTNVTEELGKLHLANDSLSASIIEKEYQLNEATAMNAELRTKLAELENEYRTERITKDKLEIVGVTIAESINVVREQNEKLQHNLHVYERKYALAVDELSKLGVLGDRVRDEFETKKQVFEEMNEKQRARVHELEKMIADLEEACRSLPQNNDEPNEKQIAELEECHRAHVEAIKVANEIYVEQLKKEKISLENDVQKLKKEMCSLQQENDKMQVKLLNLANTNRLLKVDAEEMRRQRLFLEEAWNELRTKSQSTNSIEVNETLMKKVLAADEQHLNRLMQCLDDTVKYTGLLKEEEIR